MNITKQKKLSESFKTSVKFRTDVASMCKLGFDISLKGMSADELLSILKD